MCFFPVDVLVFAFVLCIICMSIKPWFCCISIFPVFIQAVALVAVATNAGRTLELSAKQSFTLDRWRKQVPLVCGRVLSAFRHMYHRRSIFNMLNNFGTNERFLQVCARENLSSYRVTRIRMRIALESRSYKNKHGGLFFQHRFSHYSTTRHHVASALICATDLCFYFSW